MYREYMIPRKGTAQSTSSLGETSEGIGVRYGRNPCFACRNCGNDGKISVRQMYRGK
jgi:hypothetical protein